MTQPDWDVSHPASLEATPEAVAMLAADLRARRALRLAALRLVPPQVRKAHRPVVELLVRRLTQELRVPLPPLSSPGLIRLLAGGMMRKRPFGKT